MISSNLYVIYSKSKSKNDDGWWLLRGGEPVALFKSEGELNNIISLQRQLIEAKTQAVKSLKNIISG